MRNDIEGLPFIDDGYNNAKGILEAEYAQPADIVNTYVKSIMELAVIAGVNPRKVNRRNSTSNFAATCKARTRLSGSGMLKEICVLL